jgi:serpin B
MTKVVWITTCIIIVLMLITGGFFLFKQISSPTKNNPISAEGLNNVIDANNKFTLDLYSEYKTNKGNVFFSPYSISTALAMTYEGARGQTAEEIQKVFYFPKDSNIMREGYANLYTEINKTDKKYQLDTANALWAQNDYSFREDYFKTIDENYNGKVTNLDFKTDTENSRITINNWVENKTKDKIKDLIPEGILTPDTRLVLTNAIYFKANWSSQFIAEDTAKSKFTLSSGESTPSEMMHQTSYFNYGETKDLQILEMNYLGNDLSMIIILPTENNLDSLENSISVSSLAKWKKNMDTEEVQVSLPKFKFETKYLLAEDLKEMGMSNAFNKDLANFTGMWNKQRDENLYISEVIHQTFIEVTEAGTEAAAVTAITTSESTDISSRPSRPKIFTADHPFIFIIQQKDTGNILFMGRVNNPTTQ